MRENYNMILFWYYKTFGIKQLFLGVEGNKSCQSKHNGWEEWRCQLLIITFMWRMTDSSFSHSLGHPPMRWLALYIIVWSWLYNYNVLLDQITLDGQPIAIGLSTVLQWMETIIIIITFNGAAVVGNQNDWFRFVTYQSNSLRYPPYIERFLRLA